LQVEQLARVLLGEGERGAFVAVDRRPLDFGHRVPGGVAVADQVLEQAGQRRHAPADGRGRGALDFAHVAFPGDDRTVVNPAQLVGGRNADGRHEVAHVEPVGPPGARGLLLGEPDFFLGDLRELLHHRRRLRLAVVGSDDLGLRGDGHGVDSGAIPLRDKPDYHVEDGRQGGRDPGGWKSLGVSLFSNASMAGLG
jgi:hypothetical protein